VADSTAYTDALTELYQVPLTQFIAERKRLADDLKAKGDAAAAKQLAGRAKPPVSAWVVNQLWWHARDAFDDLMASADKLRKGQLSASGEHRDAIAKLRKRATAVLEDAGHTANEATLRRVATTLSAIAASGGWDPDPPGALATDRDPPGFEAVGIPAEPIEAPLPPKKKTKHEHETKHAKHDHEPAHAGNDELDAAREAQRAAEQAEKKRVEEEKTRLAHEKHRLETALRTAKAELHEREHEVKALEKQLRAATDNVERAQKQVDEIEAELAELRGN